MKIKINKRIWLSIVLLFMLFLTSCSCNGGNVSKTKYDEEKTDSMTLIQWVNKKLDEVSTQDEEGNPKDSATILAEKKQKANEIIEGYAIYSNIATKKKYYYQEDIIKNSIVPQYKSIVEKAINYEVTNENSDSKWVVAAEYRKTANCTSASNNNSKEIINSVESSVLNEDNSSVNNIVCAFCLKVAEITVTQETEPIKFYTGSEFWLHLFNNLLVFPIAWLIYAISSLCGGFYFIGLLVVTILVRTIAWPIYAKTNDMSLKMQLMQPELSVIQEKYANKQDDRSKQMMQMEMAQLYKKYKVGVGGCLMPFLQFPIFMAIYRAVSRIPYTIRYAGSSYLNDWATELNSNFLGINMFEDRNGGGTGQLVGVIILMIIVVGTQFLSQWLSQRRQKKNQDKAQEDIPAYRRKAYNQTKNSGQSSMKMMLYMMMLMMGLFVFTSKAGLGIYWCIGNLYSIAQMEINNLSSAKRMEKLKKRM